MIGKSEIFIAKPILYYFQYKPAGEEVSFWKQLRKMVSKSNVDIMSTAQQDNFKN